MEYILCAAVWVDDGQEHSSQPVATGFVVGGYRHHNIINGVLAGVYPHWKETRRTGSYTQGFVTSIGRFVDRAEGMRVAKAAGQVETEATDLYSEDLY